MYTLCCEKNKFFCWISCYPELSRTHSPLHPAFLVNIKKTLLIEQQFHQSKAASSVSNVLFILSMPVGTVHSYHALRIAILAVLVLVACSLACVLPYSAHSIIGSNSSRDSVQDLLLYQFLSHRLEK